MVNVSVVQTEAHFMAFIWYLELYCCIFVIAHILFGTLYVVADLKKNFKCSQGSTLKSRQYYRQKAKKSEKLSKIQLVWHQRVSERSRDIAIQIFCE